MNKRVSPDALWQRRGQEGLILMGCGGPLEEWESGINDWLTEEGILLDGTRFSDITPFQYRGLTCLLFAMTDDVKLDIGRLAIWRLKSHEVFGGTWLSDFLNNQLGMAESAAPPSLNEGKEEAEQRESVPEAGPETANEPGSDEEPQQNQEVITP